MNNAWAPVPVILLVIAFFWYRLSLESAVKKLRKELS